jgi:hypothetical protein
MAAQLTFNTENEILHPENWKTSCFKSCVECTKSRNEEVVDKGEATGGLGGLNPPPPPLASRITPGIRTKPQKNFFGKGQGYPIILLQPT